MSENLKLELESIISNLESIKDSLIDSRTYPAEYDNTLKIALIALLRHAGAKYDEKLEWNLNQNDKKFFAATVPDINDKGEMQRVIDTFYDTLFDTLKEKSDNNFNNVVFNIARLETLRHKDSFTDLIRGLMIYEINNENKG